MAANDCDQTFFWLKDTSVAWAVAELGGIGLVGSDVCAEQDISDLQSRVVAMVPGLRYALVGRETQRNRLETKLRNGLRPVIGTAYPAATRTFFNNNVTIKFMRGSTEVLPYLLPEIDGVVELVRSGETLRQNNLAVFADSLAPVGLALLRPQEIALK